MTTIKKPAMFKFMTDKITPSQPPPSQGEEQTIPVPNNVHDDRLEQIHHWLKTDLKLSGYQLQSASADASFRRYFRLFADQQSWIIMDAPTDKEDSTAFVDIANRLIASGVNAPQIQASNLQKGLLMITDLGDTLYLDALTDQNADKLYKAAIDALITLQSRASILDLPAYDARLLQLEMQLFRDWLIVKHLGLPAPGAWLQETFDLLAQSALEQPRVFVHRDYHSRNLTCQAENLPGILDFQDAVLGPITYDLVSLLRDCYIQWPKKRVTHWLDYYLQNATYDSLIKNIAKTQFTRWFDLMGIQRHLKASGIFARLLHRDEKDGYLQDIPRTLSYIVEASETYPELEQLNTYIKEQVLPELSKMS